MPVTFVRQANAETIDANDVNELQVAVEAIRGARYAVLATSDATAGQKAMADTALTGTADQTAINAAIDAFAYAANGPAGGTVLIVGPNVSLSGSILLRRGVTVAGAGQVTTHITATTNAPVFAAKDSAVKTDHCEVANFSLYSSVAATLIDFRWIGRSRIRSLALYGTDAAGSVGVRFGGDLTAVQESAGVVCWTNRIEGCRIAGVERCIWLEGVNAAVPTVETPNAIGIDSCELIPTNTALSTAIDIEDGDGNWIGNNDIGYAALAGGIRLGNNAGKALGNMILANRFEAVANSGSRRAIEVWGSSYSGDTIHEQFYTDDLLYPRVSVQNQTNSLTKIEPVGARELLDRSYGSPFQAPDQYWPAAFKIFLDQNYTIPNPATTYPHQTMLARFTQDATGGRTVTWGTAYQTDGWTPNPAPGAVSVIEFQYDGTNWLVVRAYPDDPRDIRLVQSAAYVGANATTAQKLFGASANGAATLLANTTYEFEAIIHMARTAGTVSHTLALLFGGTATLVSIGYLVETTVATGNTLAAGSARWVNVATATVVTAASIVATENNTIRMRGFVRVNAGGTLIPQFQYSAAPGGAPTISANSGIKFKAIGSNAVTTAGNWT